MRSLTTPSCCLCNVVRDDKTLIIKGKRGRAEQNYVHCTEFLSPGPASMCPQVHCHPEPPDDGSGKGKGGEGSHAE